MDTFSEAIAQSAPFPLIYGEASNQLQHLKEISTASSPPSLQSYYADLFHHSTIDLGPTLQHHLINICLAYKTKSAVLQYLSYLQKDVFPWAETLLDVVQRRGWDTAELADDEEEQEEEFFIIPTLPLAFPSLAIELWAFAAPLAELTLAGLLAHASALQLRLGAELEGVLRESLKPMSFRGYEALFEHLMMDTEKLVGWSGQKVYYAGESIENAAVKKQMGKKRPRAVKRGGYGRREFEEYLEVYRVGRLEREKEKEKEKEGRRKRARDENDVGVQEERPAKKRRSVGFKEDLVQVREIEARKQQTPTPTSTPGKRRRDEIEDEEVTDSAGRAAGKKKRVRYTIDEDEDLESTPTGRQAVGRSVDRKGLAFPAQPRSRKGKERAVEV